MRLFRCAAKKSNAFGTKKHTTLLYNCRKLEGWNEKMTSKQT